jgi:hypothetical protein
MWRCRRRGRRRCGVHTVAVGGTRWFDDTGVQGVEVGAGKVVLGDSSVLPFPTFVNQPTMMLLPVAA